MGSIADTALEAIGFKKPEPPARPPPPIPEAAQAPRPLRLQVAASDALNLDPQERSLSLVVRVYKLRNISAFQRTPYDAFGDAIKEKQALGDDLIEARELVLAPGQKRTLSEKWAREATHVGVVGLFRAPAQRRWRFAFELDELKSDEQQFLLGAHACGFSVAFGTPVGLEAAALRFQSADCSPPRRLPPSRPMPASTHSGK